MIYDPKKSITLESLGLEEYAPEEHDLNEQERQEQKESVSERAGAPESITKEAKEKRRQAEYSSPGQLSEIGASAEEISLVAKQDVDFLAALAMPTVFKFCFPPIYKEGVWPWLLDHAKLEREFPQLALGLPRGFAKTTLIKLFFLMCILFTNRKFLLVIGATAKLAENIVSDITDMLEEPNIKSTFGDWKLGIEKDTQSVKKFGFRGRNIILAGIGAESSLRGLNMKNERPDVMLFDDIQSAECAESKVQSDSLEKWMVGTAMKAKSPLGCLFIFVANMYPTKYSILRKLKYNPTWIKFIAGGILTNAQGEAESLWEELQPLSQLLKEFENDLALGRPEIFYSEVLNDENAASSKLIDLTALPALPYEDGDISAGNFIVIDPSTHKENADAVSVGYFEIYDAKPVLIALEEGRMSPGETIRSALTFALQNNCRLIVVESNAYQYSLLYWFDFICQQLEIQGIQCVDMYSGKAAKNSRILKMLRAYAAGEIFVADSCKAAVHLQIAEFNPLKLDNTDGLLDLLTYAPRVIDEYGEYVVAGNLIEQQEFEAIEVPEFNSAF